MTRACDEHGWLAMWAAACAAHAYLLQWICHNSLFSTRPVSLMCQKTPVADDAHGYYALYRTSLARASACGFWAKPPNEGLRGHQQQSVSEGYSLFVACNFFS